MNTKIGFKFQVTATLGLNSLYNWCYQTMWLFSGALDDPEDNTVGEEHVAEELYSAVKSLMHAIWTEKKETQQNAAHRMIQMANPGTRRSWSELELANGKPLVQIAKENAHHIDLQWTENPQPKLQTLVERYTCLGASGAGRVHSWQLACVLLVLYDTNDHNNISGQWYDEWPLDTWEDSPIFGWLRDTFLRMLVANPVEYPEPDHDNKWRQALLPEHDRN